MKSRVTRRCITKPIDKGMVPEARSQYKVAPSRDNCLQTPFSERFASCGASWTLAKQDEPPKYNESQHCKSRVSHVDHYVRGQQMLATVLEEETLEPTLQEEVAGRGAWQREWTPALWPTQL